METHMESETQCTCYNSMIAYDSLTPLARHYLKRFNDNVLISPLEACRSMMQNAKGEILHTLMQVEAYLILED